jgi:hypothetical protein
MYRNTGMMGNIIDTFTGTAITTIINNVVTRSGKDKQECK